MRTAFGSLMSLAIGLGVLSVPVAATGATRYVDDDGRAGRTGCAGTTVVPRRVQRAIDTARPDDTILVCPGVYTEQLAITGARDGLTVKALEPWTAVIRSPRRLTGSPMSLITIDGVDRVRIQWLQLAIRTTAPCDRLHNAVLVRRAREAQVRALHIQPLGTDTTGTCGYRQGIVIAQSTAAFVGYNTIRDFRLTGILIKGSSTSATVRSNSIRYLQAAGAPEWHPDSGISADGGPRVTIRENVIRGAMWGGISVNLGTGSVVARNRVQGASRGMGFYADGPRKTRSIVRDNVVTDGDEIGLFVIDGSVYSRNRVRGHSTGVLAVGGSATFLANDLRGNDWDCIDEEANQGAPSIWRGNLGDRADPAWICSPGP